jgi:hypothetical protein
MYQPNYIELTGFWMSAIGLILCGVFVNYFYYQIRRSLKAEKIKENFFPPFSFYFQLREIALQRFASEKQKRYLLLLRRFKFSLIITIGMIFLGFLILSLGANLNS